MKKGEKRRKTVNINDYLKSTDSESFENAIANKEYRPGGSLCNTHVMHNDWTKREKDIWNITIRNVTAYSNLCLIIRLLPAMSHIRNVIIDGVVDNTPESISHWAAIDLGGG